MPSYYILWVKIISFYNHYNDQATAGRPGNLGFIPRRKNNFFYNKSQEDALFLNLILVNISTCFGQTYCPSSGVLILYSQQQVFAILVTLTVRQQTVSITCMTNTYCCEYSIKTHDDGQQVCSKHVEFFTKIRFRDSASCWLLL